MSTVATATPVTLDRYELPGNLASLAALASSGQITIRPHELIRTTDGRVYHWTTSALEIVSAPVHHGTVADVAALDGVYLLPSCTRGVHQGDTAYVTAAACEYRVASGVNATATWSACATLPTIPTTPSEVGADPAGTADAAVSTHNTATDSHADLRTLVGDRVPISTTRLGTVGSVPLTTTALTAADWAALPVGWSGIISADVAVASGLPAADVYHLQKISNRDVSGGAAYQAQGYLTPTLYIGAAATSDDLPAWLKAPLTATSTTLSTVGEALLSLATPSSAKIPRVNADATVTLIDVPSGGGGGSGGWITHAGPHFVGERTWVGNGDANGVVYFAGSIFGGGTFINPCVGGGPMAILRSSNGDGTAQQLTDRQINVSYSANIPGSWVCIDLGIYAPLLESYSLQHQSTYAVDYIRTWRLQGTNTISAWSSSGVVAASWIDLDVRSGDTTIAAVNQWGHWVCNQAPSQAYRYLRLLQDGANSELRHYLTITEMEFYGSLSFTTPLPAGAAGWLKSTAVDLWMLYYGASLDLGIVV